MCNLGHILARSIQTPEVSDTDTVYNAAEWRASSDAEGRKLKTL